MKILFLFLLSLVGCASKPRSFTVQEIAPETYVVTDKIFYDSNVLVAKMPGDVVFIASSPFDTESGKELVLWIREKWSPKKIIAVNTHFHTDGTGSNAAFKDEGVEIWSSELTKKLYLEKASAYRENEAKSFSSQPEIAERIKNRKTVSPDYTFNESVGKDFTFGEEKVVLIYPGPGHSPDNVVAYMPDRKVLYGTCMIRPGQALGNLGDANLIEWATSVKRIEKLDAKIVIPGHGPIGGHELITNTIEAVNKVKKPI